MGSEDQGLSAAGTRYQVVPRTLSFILNDDDVLLLKGAPHKRLWANLYNGVGGHVERDEDVYAAALREVCEETGWEARDLKDLRLRAVINVDAGDPQTGILLFVFTARALKRLTRASTEGSLTWAPRSQLWDYDLVEDLPVLLPRLFSMPEDAPPLYAHYSYDRDDRLVMRFGKQDLPGTD